jgi:hypothetical protein
MYDRIAGGGEEFLQVGCATFQEGAREDGFGDAWAQVVHVGVTLRIGFTV